MGIFVRHEPCPVCGSRDNLGRYDDGSAWCFGCGHIEPPKHIPLRKKEVENDSQLQLDPDLCSDFPRHVVEWLARYDVSVGEAIKHGWKYCPSRDQLVFIFRDEDGTVILTQARNFTHTKRKYFTQGSVAEVLPIFRVSSGTGGPGVQRSLSEVSGASTIVVVEDIVSAAKIARQSDAIPCLGSDMPLRKLNALRVLGYETAVFWLDYDKWTNAVKLADQAKLLGFKTKVIQTELDPKEYTNAEIKEHLT